MRDISQTECRVCGKDRFSIWGRRDSLTLYKCKNCDLVFFFPYPNRDQLEAYYNAQYHSERAYNGIGEAGRLRKKMYELDIKDLEKTVPVRGRFLDVGCAEGVFLSMLNDKWEKYGIDISEKAIAQATQKKGIIANVKDIKEVDNKFFDVIHLRGVFEHLLDPLELVRLANQKLRTDGFLVLSNTPNIGGFVPRLFRGRFKLVLPNEHLHYFSVKTIKKLAHQNGFIIKRVIYPYFGSPYCSFFKNTLEILVNFVTGKQSPPYWGNIFTVYAQKI